jgi:hypothetical protein
VGVEQGAGSGCLPSSALSSSGLAPRAEGLPAPRMTAETNGPETESGNGVLVQPVLNSSRLRENCGEKKEPCRCWCRFRGAHSDLRSAVPRSLSSVVFKSRAIADFLCGKE